jgi:hypothetical protein
MTTRVISSTTLSQSEADRDDHRSTGSIRSLGMGDLGGRGEERRAEGEERPGGRTPGPIEIARQVKHRASQRPPPDPPRTQQTASTPLAQTGERSPTLEGTASVHSARTRRRAHEALTAPCPNARPGTASRTADGWDPGPSPRRQHQLQVARWGQSGALSNLLTLCCTHHQLVHNGQQPRHHSMRIIPWSVRWSTGGPEAPGCWRTKRQLGVQAARRLDGLSLASS